MADTPLKNKTALVTGSTSGIGWGIAQVLAAQGANIVLNGFGDGALIADLIAQIERHGVTAAHDAADMTAPDQIAAMVKKQEDAGRTIQILVNNAGIQHTAKIEEFPVDKWNAVIAINLSSSFHTMQACIPGMRRAGWGRIVNIASAHGKVASANKSAYVAAKHGIVGLTKVAALELANSGVTANAICPGWVLTPLVQKQLDDRAAREGKSLDQVTNELLSEKQPLLEFSTPEQIGSLTAYLCSDQARTISGAALSIDGAWTAT